VKVTKKYVGLVSVTLALVGASALVIAGVVGLGLAPAKKAEALSAQTLAQSTRMESIVTSAEADFDAADKSAALKKAAKAAPAAITIVVFPKEPVVKKKPVTTKAVARKKVAVSRGANTRSGATGSGWNKANVSWYGPGLYGHTMAGGGTLTRSSMVVAHRSLSFGTRVEFSYHGKTCVAVVRDRGPYVSGRTFDLGPGTASALGFSGASSISYRILG